MPLARVTTGDLVDLNGLEPAQLVECLLRWFRSSARDLPWRNSTDAYRVWVSEVMLQQTQVATVIPYFERWMGAFPDTGALAAASPERVLKLWEGLGYYSRARNFQKAAQLVVERHQGRVPDDPAQLLSLPGIGRYTAGAIGSIAFNQPVPILDGNVIRVLTRVFAVAGDPKESTVNTRLWQLAEALVTCAKTFKFPRSRGKLQWAGACSALNQSMMELGALVCTPSSPQCAECPLRECCRALRSNEVHRFPELAARPTPTRRRFVAIVAESNGRYLVRQRPAGVVNARLWEFPNQEVAADEDVDVTSLSAALIRAPVSGLKEMITIRHSITRYRITLNVFSARASSSGATRRPHWCLPDELEALAFTSAHRKVLRHLLASSGDKSR